jgi:epoxide hydrolase
VSTSAEDTAPRTATAATELRPFRVHVPQERIDDVRDRLARTIWPDELPDVGTAYGVTVEYVRQLAARWVDGFDWRALEDRINRYPQFTTEIDGETIHFLHVRSPEPDATPLILSHGWPGSVLEYLDVIEPLTDPAAHGGNPEDAFHLVIPSLPGFGFSGPTTSPGWNRYRTARAWDELMRRLGYDRYGAVGNDAGSFIAPEVGRHASGRVIGAHVTQIFSFPSGDPSEIAQLTEADHAALARLQWFHENLSAFNALHSQQPQTLAFAISDSPAGLLAWNGQLLPDTLDLDFVVGNIALYWFTGTAASAIRFYYEDAHTEHPRGSHDRAARSGHVRRRLPVDPPLRRAGRAGCGRSRSRPRSGHRGGRIVQHGDRRSLGPCGRSRGRCDRGGPAGRPRHSGGVRHFGTHADGTDGGSVRAAGRAVGAGTDR